MERVGVLFSGGKDSTYAAYIAHKKKYEIKCLISVFSENQESYMFHTPSINQVEKQARVMGIPLIVQHTKGIRENELLDLELAIKNAKEKYKLDAIVTGAVASVYQATRIKKICDKLKLNCINPLWQKDELEYLKELVENRFKIIITGVFAYSLDKSWLGREIDKKFIKDVEELYKKYKIHPAGEGGEFETFVLNCPLFSRALVVKNKQISGRENSWRMDIEVE